MSDPDRTHRWDTQVRVFIITEWCQLSRCERAQCSSVKKLQAVEAGGGRWTAAAAEHNQDWSWRLNQEEEAHKDQPRVSHQKGYWASNRAVQSQRLTVNMLVNFDPYCLQYTDEGWSHMTWTWLCDQLNMRMARCDWNAADWSGKGQRAGCPPSLPPQILINQYLYLYFLYSLVSVLP